MSKTLEAKVETKPLNLRSASRKILSNIESFDWILFTSKNAVKYFIRLLRDEKTRIPKHVQIAAVGPVTAAALRKHKIRVAKMSTKTTSENLVRELHYLHGKRVLFPRSDIAPRGLIDSMRKHGAKVTVIPLYTTVPIPLTNAQKAGLLAGTYDTISFKSPSGIRGLLAQFTATEKRKILAIPAEAIGPTTSRSAREAGFRRVMDLSL